MMKIYRLKGGSTCSCFEFLTHSTIEKQLMCDLSSAPHATQICTRRVGVSSKLVRWCGKILFDAQKFYHRLIFNDSNDCFPA